jgi:eukaryotic-like serine/threonine-protein kinase
MSSGTRSIPPPVPWPRHNEGREPVEGLRLGRYELIHRIARGGMAEVWAARQVGQLGFSRVVAMKMILPELSEDAAFRKMFLEEARLASRIRHANVVDVLDLGEEDTVVFQVMSLQDGDSLAGLQKRARRGREPGRIPEAIVLRILGDALAGLHAAHELCDDAGHPLHLVHRDVSPQNILVGLDGVARLADFGVAKALGRLADETEAGQIKGKYGYLAPEIVERKAADRRSDVFSAGVVLWEALTGARLFGGQDAVETLHRVRTLAVPDPRTLATDVSKAVADVATRALERNPGDRFATAADMADALEQAARASGKEAGRREVSVYVSELVSPEGSSSRPKTARPPARAASHPSGTGVVSRRQIGVGVFAALTLAIAAGSLVRLLAGHPVAPALASTVPAPIPSAALPHASADASGKSDQGSTPVPAPAVVAPSSASAAAAKPASSPRRPAPVSTPSPHPKFGNPYGN